MRAHLTVLVLSALLAACSGPDGFRLIAEAPTEIPTEEQQSTAAHETDEFAPEEAPGTEEAATEPQPATEALADPGPALFATHCAVCHGPEGRGDGPTAVALDPKPVDLTGPRPDDKRGQPGGRRVVIADGSPGTTMPAYADVFSDEEMAALLSHVHKLRWGPDAELPEDHLHGDDCRHDRQGRGEGRGRGGKGRGGQGRGGGR